MTPALNSLKRSVFYELLDLVGRVFIVVRYSPEVDLGSRAFSDEEKQSGLTLVFTSRMRVQWEEHGITTTLTFGARAQKCFIPSNDVAAVYSPEMQVQLTAAAQDTEHADSRQAGTKPQVLNQVHVRRGLRRAKECESKQQHGKLLKVDFAQKLRRKKDDTGKEDA